MHANTIPTNYCGIHVKMTPEYMHAHAEEEKRREMCRKAYEKDWRFLLNFSFERVEKEKGDEKIKCDILNGYGIFSKVDLLHWIRKNHPDKGGDTEVFVTVISKAKERSLL